MPVMTLKQARTRKAHYLTQQQLADAAGLDKSVISRIERGENTNPSIDTVTKLEAVMGLKRGTLVFGAHAKAVA